MVTGTARFTVNEEAALRKKVKRWYQEVLELKLEKGNNIRILCTTTAFERVKEISVNTVIKSNM